MNILAEAQEFLSYDPLTGEFRFLCDRGNNPSKGKIAGWIDKDGYMQVMVGKKMVRMHKLAWAWVHGEWPRTVDHINRDKTDNRIANLRMATPSQQVMNTPRRKDNTSGHKGISWDASRSRWQASVWANGKTVRRRFEDFVQACEWRRTTASSLHGEFFAGE
jgi:hypothetical protein